MRSIVCLLLDSSQSCSVLQANGSTHTHIHTHVAGTMSQTQVRSGQTTSVTAGSYFFFPQLKLGKANKDKPLHPGNVSSLS